MTAMPSSLSHSKTTSPNPSLMPTKLDMPNSVPGDYALNFNTWTMKHPLLCRTICLPKVLTTNSFCQTYTAAMLPREPSAHSRTTSLPASAVPTKTSHFIFGTDCCLKWNYPSTYCRDHASIPASLHGYNSTEHSTAPQLLHQAFERVGWYLGLALKLHWCYTVWITEMCATHLQHTDLASHQSSHANHIIHDLVLAGTQDTALQNPSANSPLAPVSPQPKCGTATAHDHPSWQVECSSTASPDDYSTSSEVSTISTAPAAPLRVTLATPPDMEASPSNDLLPECSPHLSMAHT